MVNNKTDGIVKIGQEVIVTCAVNTKPLKCKFAQIGGKEYDVGVSNYPSRGISKIETGENDCSMKINSVIEEDHGYWNCTILGKTETSDYEHVTRNFTLKVAIAPTKVYLQEQNQVLTSLFMNISAQNSVKIKCIAENASVEPIFKWFLSTYSS